MDETAIKQLQVDMRAAQQDLVQLKANEKHTEQEIASLRASRHEYGNILQKHELAIDQLKYQGLTLSDSGDSTAEEVKKLKDQVTQLASDVRLTLWKIGVVVGIGIWILNRIANKVGW